MCENFESKIISVEILKKKKKNRYVKSQKSILKILFGESLGRSMHISFFIVLFMRKSNIQ